MVAPNAGRKLKNMQDKPMNDPEILYDGLLIIRPANPVETDTLKKLREHFEASSKHLRARIVVLPHDVEATYVDQGLHQALSALTDKIDKIVNINQALLGYMMDLDEQESPDVPVPRSLDG